MMMCSTIKAYEQDEDLAAGLDRSVTHMHQISVGWVLSTAAGG